MNAFHVLALEVTHHHLLNVLLVTEPTLFSVAAAGKVASVTAPLCNTAGHSSPGSSVHGIFQARIPEWVAISSSRGSSPTQGWGLCPLRLLHYRWVHYHQRHLGSRSVWEGALKGTDEVKVTGGLLEATTIASIAVVWSSIRLSFIGDFSFLWVLERYSLCCEYSSVLLYAQVQDMLYTCGFISFLSSGKFS